VIAGEFIISGLNPINAFKYSRGVPTVSGSWNLVDTYASGLKTFQTIPAVKISDDGTRLIVIDLSGIKSNAIFYNIGASSITQVGTAIDLATIDGVSGLRTHIISNLTSVGFTIIAKYASSDGTYQLVVLLQLVGGITINSNTYTSSDSGLTWTIIPQNSVYPFNLIFHILMTADKGKTYCVCDEGGSSTQSLRTSITPTSHKCSTSPTNNSIG
jgi:hypothetical protein